MFAYTIKQANITGIANGAKVTGTVPASGVHTALYLRCLHSTGVALTAAEIIADIGDIVIRLGNRTIIDADARFLLARQQYYGSAHSADNVDGIIPIDYTRPYLESPAERIRTALGMQGQTSYSIEIDLAASLTHLAIIEVYSESLDVVRPLGEYVEVRKLPLNFASIAGTHEIGDMPGRMDNNRAYLALHAYMATTDAAFDVVTVKANSRDVFAEVPVKLNQVNLEKAGRQAQTNFYHIDFAVKNHVQSRLRMGSIQDFRQQITFSGTAAPGSYVCYTESLVDIDDSGAGFTQK